MSVDLDREGGSGARCFLRVQDLSKRFGSTRANDGIDLSFHLGEIHALLGENGAGKSTLIKTLAGIYRADGGSIIVEGARREISDPGDARALGISVVHQRLELIPTLSVFDNMALQESGLGRVNRAELGKRANRIAEDLGFKLDLQANVASLSAGAQQRVEIVRALLSGGKLVILDEPTTILAPAEVETLFRMLRGLADRGSAVVFVTHRLAEAVEHSDRVTILRNGRVVGRFQPGDVLDQAEIVRLMVGDVVASVERGATPRLQEVPIVLSLDGVAGHAPTGMQLNTGRLDIHEGEIVGVAGVEGNGQADLASLIVGGWRPEHGAIRYQGRPLGDYTAAQRGQLIADIPEAISLALAAELTLWENLGLRTMCWHERPSSRTRRRLKAKAIDRALMFDIRSSSIDALVATLSGGNQQRAIVARELSGEPRIIVAVYPTRGLDVRSAALVKRSLRSLADRGAGVVFITSDLDELFETSHRIAVMFSGKIVAVLDAHRTTIWEVGQYMVRGASRG